MIDHADHVANDAAFAGGVHSLQHEQDRPKVPGTPVRVEHLLEVGQSGAAFGEQFLTVGLVAFEPGGGGVVDIGDAGVGGCPQYLHRR